LNKTPSSDIFILYYYIQFAALILTTDFLTNVESIFLHQE